MVSSINIDSVRNSWGKTLLIFDHGLGDFLHFLPVYFEFQKQAHVTVALAASKYRQFHYVYPPTLEADKLVLKNYAQVYKIQYPDTKSFSMPIEIYDEPSKPYLCAYYELGMSFFVWSPYQIKSQSPKLNRVGVHFFGHTGSQEKFCPLNVAEQIWKEIQDAGFEPFECHQRPNFRERYSDCGEDGCNFIPENQTIRYQKPDLRLMISEIGKCKYFVGVDSGPLYLAGSILGHDNLIGLENKKKIAYYCPKHVPAISVREYQPGSIYERLKLLEVRHEID